MNKVLTNKQAILTVALMMTTNITTFTIPSVASNNEIANKGCVSTGDYTHHLFLA